MFTSMHEIHCTPPFAVTTSGFEHLNCGVFLTQKEKQKKDAEKVYDCFCCEIIYILSDE